MQNFTYAIFLGLILSACSADTDGNLDQKPDDLGEAYEKEADGKADAWNRRNNPEGLRIELNKNLAELPLEGEAENRAWPDTYWPTYKDSVNARWQTTGTFLDDLSPVEKYDVVFNNWDPFQVENLRPFDGKNCDPESFDAEYYEHLGPLASYVSMYKGNQDTRTAALAGHLTATCTAKADSECVSACGEEPEAIDEKATHQRCVDRCDRGGIETWWGLCHAWAPAAILEKEPLHQVTMPTQYGDINFEVGDIKALFALVYDRTSATLIGGRCNDFDVKRDEKTGRIINDDCRDLNAGAFHVAMTNLLGIQKRGFVEDRTFDYEVWNQPVKGFEVKSMEEITVEEAHALLNVELDASEENNAMSADTDTEGANGETIDTPQNDCVPGFTPEAGQYCYNLNVDSLFKVETTLHWLTESGASTHALGAEHITRYSRTDRYTYILEVKDGQVVGGEWYGDSIMNHPDFVWLPFAPRVMARNLDAESVKMLNRLAQTSAADRALPMTPVKVESGEIVKMIPDNDPSGIEHTLTVNDEQLVSKPAKIELSVDVSHTYSGDLKVAVRTPDGKLFILRDREGGSTHDIKKTFKVPYTGELNGEWTITVADLYNRDLGQLNHWHLHFIEDVSRTAAASEPLSFENSRSATIPDNDPEGINSYIDIEATGTIETLTLDINVLHTYVGDLVVTLKKGGVSQVIHNREGGSDDNLIRSFDTTAFKGMELSGRWYLSIVDNARHDFGSREGWTITVTQ